jgi:TatD DNase family protein
VRLVDSHAHLQAERLRDDRDAVLASAWSAGVERILVPGWDLASSEAAVELAGTDPRLDAAVGIHPHDAAAGTDWSGLVALARERVVVAIGETGLDYDRLFSPRHVQLENLRRHIGLAQELDKPLILHCRSARGQREAQDELIAELRAAGPVLGVLHSYSGPLDYGQAALALGLAVSFSGLVFRDREEASAGVARAVPSDRLLVETDSPYLPPPGGNRRRNEPQWVGITAQWLAEQRGGDATALGGQLVANYERIFRSEP